MFLLTYSFFYLVREIEVEENPENIDFDEQIHITIAETEVYWLFDQQPYFMPSDDEFASYQIQRNADYKAVSLLYRCSCANHRVLKVTRFVIAVRFSTWKRSLRGTRYEHHAESDHCQGVANHGY